MCGIVGIWLKNESEIVQKEQLEAGISAIRHRGPDVSNVKIDANVGLAHARLSIIDLSELGNQPMVDPTGRYSLVFNGEIYNYKELVKDLPEKITLKSNSDTEVLLHYLIHFGEKGLLKLNGFFAFIFYDHQQKEVLFARDRYGIKPLMMYEDQNQIIFSSEISSFFNFDIDKRLDKGAINLLFQLTYIPAPFTILEKAEAIKPGTYGRIKKGKVELNTYYKLTNNNQQNITYNEALKEVKLKVEASVKRRLMSDVPIGSFLSGGVDSSIVSLVAKQNKKDLKTFSIGFDVPYFDESEFAIEMAERIGSNHHQIQLTKADFTKRFQSFLSSNDQPFADSSAFAVYLLSEKTKEYVTVCLSGDGADELFAGYRKHEAEFRIQMMPNYKKCGLKTVAKLTQFLPKGRHGKWQEVNRKIQKLASGLKLSAQERYWQWLTFIDVTEKDELLITNASASPNDFSITSDLNSMLLADQSFVLPNDMLTKVDRMSMAHGLEVRTPFLDFELVEFVNSLPFKYKLNESGRKKLLIDAFKDQLPERIYNRPKKGFEIPLFDWLKEEIAEVFSSELFSKDYIEQQGIFNYRYINSLKSSFKSSQFGDKVYLIWTLLIFQNWWHKNIWKQ